MVSKGQIVGIDWNCTTQLHSHVLAHMNSLTVVPVNTHYLTLAHHRVSSSSVVEHPTRSRGSWVQIPSGTRIFSESTFLLEFT